MSETPIRISIIGNTKVGKSCLIYRFINYNIPKIHDPTIEDKYKSVAKIDKLTYNIEILDTGGEKEYQNKMDTWINFGDGFILVFSINDEESFNCLNDKIERIFQIKNGKICPILLVGNKNDLERKINYSDARNLGNKWGCEYIETSAVNDFNCKEVFEILAKKIFQIKQNDKKKKKDCCCSIY